MDTEKSIYNFENKNSIFWYIGLLGLCFLSVLSFITIKKSFSIISILFFTSFTTLLIIQIYSKLTKRHPFLEITLNTIIWGSNKRNKRIVEFKNLKKIVLNYGIEDNNILLIEKSGDTHKIYQGYHYLDMNDLKKTFEGQQANFGFLISQGDSSGAFYS